MSGEIQCIRSASSGLGAEVVTNKGSMAAWRLAVEVLVDGLRKFTFAVLVLFRNLTKMPPSI